MKKLELAKVGATLFPDENTILFWGGIFSQWYKCNFPVKINEVYYQVNCAEQAMMLFKAAEFNDTFIFNNILEEKDPREQKLLGRMVKNFVPDVWNSKAIEYVTHINFQKFSHNTVLKDILILTHPYNLVEASPSDRIWGIGYSENDPTVFENRKNWGTNWLGISIENARKLIMETN